MARTGPYVLGIDCGTQSLRAVVVDVNGKLIASASRQYPIDYPHVAWAEQDANDWWTAAREVVPKAVAEAGIDAKQIAGLSVDGTSCTVVVTKRDGTPLRPVILWMDQRAHLEADQVTATRDERLRFVSWAESPEWMIPKAMWLRNNQPDVYEQADLIIEGTDWLMHRLTGEWAASLNNVTCKWNYASVDGGWPTELLSSLDFSELVDKWPSTVLPMGERAGLLTPEAAAELAAAAGRRRAPRAAECRAALAPVPAANAGGDPGCAPRARRL